MIKLILFVVALDFQISLGCKLLAFLVGYVFYGTPTMWG